MDATSILRFLPDDVLEEILMRLPVKDLLRFKCVCKQWCSLIGDLDFNMKHYRFQYAIKVAEDHNVPLFIDTYSYPPDPTQFYLLSKHGGDNIVLNLNPELERDIPFAFTNEPLIHFSCMGVVNGIVGLQWTRCCFQWGPNRLALWNPATRDFKDIPSWPIIPDNKITSRTRVGYLGLGFDLQTNDCKILGLIEFDGNDINPTIHECHLYSLKANSWKRIKEAPCVSLYTLLSITDAYMDNGVYYWLAVDKGELYRMVIISFNFSTESFREFELPEGAGCWCQSNKHFRSYDKRVYCRCDINVSLGKYKERPALFVTRNLENSDRRIEIWAVTRFRDDDVVVPLSWQLEVAVVPAMSFHVLRTKTIRASGDLLVTIDHGEYQGTEGCLYDPSTQNSRTLGLRPISCCFRYVESLFYLSKRPF